MIDRQKVYNKVRNHLLNQNAVSQSPGCDSCAYRYYDPNTKRVLKCAIGCLIPFRHYNPSMEGKTPGGRIVDGILALSIPGYDTLGDRQFLLLLQEIHDTYEPEVWQEGLDDFAKYYGLKVQA